MKKFVLFFFFLSFEVQAEFFPQESTHIESNKNYEFSLPRNEPFEIYVLGEFIWGNKGKLPITSLLMDDELVHSIYHLQEPPIVIPHLLHEATFKNVSLFISLKRQRLYLKVGDEIAIDSPLCSGNVTSITPSGHFTILQKDSDHHSNVYGNFVNKNGKIVRGVNLKIDSAPNGTTYVGAPMRWFMRLTWQGIGLHAGILRGYPASHGCIRLPEHIAKIIYGYVKIGTPVIITD